MGSPLAVRRCNQTKASTPDRTVVGTFSLTVDLASAIRRKGAGPSDDPIPGNNFRVASRSACRRIPRRRCASVIATVTRAQNSEEWSGCVKWANSYTTTYSLRAGLGKVESCSRWAKTVGTANDIRVSGVSVDSRSMRAVVGSRQSRRRSEVAQR